MKFIRVVKATNELEDIEKEIQRLQELKQKHLKQKEEDDYLNSLFLYKFTSIGKITANFDPESAPDNLIGRYEDEDGEEVKIEVEADDVREEFLRNNENAEIKTEYSELDYDEDEVFDELKSEDENFMRYIPNNLKKLLVKIKLESLKLKDDKCKVVYAIYCKKQLNEGELQALDDYMSGQLADGIGEGFEQEPFETQWETDLQEYYRDGARILVDEYFKFDAKYYVSLWNNKTSIEGPIGK